MISVTFTVTFTKGDRLRHAMTGYDNGDGHRDVWLAENPDLKGKYEEKVGIC